MPQKTKSSSEVLDKSPTVDKVEYKMVPNAVNVLLNKREHFMMSELFLPNTSVVPVEQLVRYVYVCVSGQ